MKQERHSCFRSESEPAQTTMRVNGHRPGTAVAGWTAQRQLRAWRTYFAVMLLLNGGVALPLLGMAWQQQSRWLLLCGGVVLLMAGFWGRRFVAPLRSLDGGNRDGL